MKSTCGECPFNKQSLNGWLADYTVEELHRLVMSEQHFPCHMQLPDTNDDFLDFGEAEEYPRCVGSLMYMKKNAKMPRDIETKKLTDSFTKEELDQVLSMREFIEHHNIFN